MMSKLNKTQAYVTTDPVWEPNVTVVVPYFRQITNILSHNYEDKISKTCKII